ncbi:MAG TPA: T9SS type A sorting domain-containing protein [Bacteroidia bacterium]|nr:T9SS type A sorting domain-containing protein [Bacteroidia bacterium]HRH07586.1 T9SS type A sorting domain-containing protein [Bacteroidia bacterium]
MKNLIHFKKIFIMLLSALMLMFSQLSFSQATVNLDPTFNSGSGFDSPADKIVIQPNGKILAMGYYFTNYHGTSVNQLARINSDGTLDASFNIIANFFDSNFVSISDVVFQANGKILIGGSFSSYTNIPCRNLVRLNSDYSYDTTFQVGTLLIGSVENILVRNDGKIIVTGYYKASISSPIESKVFLLNSDGSVDPSFSIGIGVPGTAVGQTINCYYLQSDNKLLVGGNFSAWNGNPADNLVRLDTLGNIDNSFVSSNYNNDVYKILQQPDGKIIVGGLFTTINGNSRSKIARLNTNGNIDFTFNPGTGFSINGSAPPADVRSMLLEPSGKIILSGDFDSFNGNPAQHLARLNSNGSFDNTFNVGTGFHGFFGSTGVNLARQSDGKIIALGDFNDYNTTTSNNITRLDGPALTFSVKENSSELNSITIYPNPAKEAIILDLKEFANQSNIRITNIIGEEMGQFQTGETKNIDIRNLPSGLYFISIQNKNGISIGRFVKE